MLTETEIKSLEPDAAKHVWVNDGDGLYLRIAPSDRRTWIWRTKRGTKTTSRSASGPACPSRPRGPSLRSATAVDNCLCYPRDRLP
jgi:hypothetical protein